MSYSPQPIIDLARLWVKHGGINLGIVGDAAHNARGTSYHLGKDHLLSAAYSNQTHRDKAGLSNAASALDLGHKNKPELRKFSTWLAAQARANKPGFSDVREIIWSPDGKKVLRWDRERGYASSPRAGEADNSHLTHTHISFYRDSEHRSKTGLFAPYWGVVKPPVLEADMPALTSYIPGHIASVKATANVRSAPKLNATVLRALKSPETWVVTGWVKGDVDLGSDQWIVRWYGGRWEYTAKSNVSAGPAAKPDSTPYSQSDMDKLIRAGDALRTKIANAKAALG